MIFITVWLGAVSLNAYAEPKVTLLEDAEADTLAVKIDGKQAFVYQYGTKWAIPHLYPVHSPSGKLLTLQKAVRPEKFPHHRSLWIVDKVKMGSLPEVDFYHEWKNLVDKKKPELGHKHFIKQVKFTEKKAAGKSAVIGAELQWLVNKTQPVLDEKRTMTVTALGGGEYLIDMQWSLTAAYGDVHFRSDWVHYAWPYLRMHKQFNGDSGGTITADTGDTGQDATNGKYYKWIDYSNTVDSVTEGLAVFVYPDGEKHRWLTRNYGTFGPKRPDRYSGKFTLKKGKTLVGRVGILIHKGDVKTANVAMHYQQYAKTP